MTDPEIKYQALGQRLYEARLNAAMRQRPVGEVSQERMAELVGKIVGRRISQAQWSYWEQGRREPELDIIRAVSAISGLAPEYIAFGPENDPAAPPAPPTEPLAPADAPERARAAKKRRRAG